MNKFFIIGFQIEDDDIKFRPLEFSEEDIIDLFKTREMRIKLGDYEELTPREIEVASLIAYGYTSPEIAQAFSISVRTVEAHRYNIRHKLNLRTTKEINRYVFDTFPETAKDVLSGVEN